MSWFFHGLRWLIRALIISNTKLQVPCFHSYEHLNEKRNNYLHICVADCQWSQQQGNKAVTGYWSIALLSAFWPEPYLNVSVRQHGIEGSWGNFHQSSFVIPHKLPGQRFRACFSFMKELPVFSSKVRWQSGRVTETYRKNTFSPWHKANRDNWQLRSKLMSNKVADSTDITNFLDIPLI